VPNAIDTESGRLIPHETKFLVRIALSDEGADVRTYLVVINDEEQYSVWLADRELPPGWRAEGKSGTKDECLAHIAEVWTDMRPRSLRNRLASDG
jgi:MbtH protein